MGLADLQSAIFTNEARAETLTNEITDNSEDLRLAQKHLSKDISDVKAKYAPEKERINNEIASLDKVENRDEYEDLINELKDVKDAEEREVEALEEQMNDHETAIQLETDLLETQLEEVNTQTESFKEMLQQNIENSFSYFQ